MITFLAGQTPYETSQGFFSAIQRAWANSNPVPACLSSFRSEVSDSMNRLHFITTTVHELLPFVQTQYFVDDRPFHGFDYVEASIALSFVGHFNRNIAIGVFAADVACLDVAEHRSSR